MRIGTLVKNKNTQSMGIVVKDQGKNVRIYWLRSGNVRIWGKNAPSLEVLCK